MRQRIRDDTESTHSGYHTKAKEILGLIALREEIGTAHKSVLELIASKSNGYSPIDLCKISEGIHQRQ